MTPHQTAELLEALGALREAVRELRGELRAVRIRLRVLELVAVFAAGAFLAELGPAVLKLLA